MLRWIREHSLTRIYGIRTYRRYIYIYIYTVSRTTLPASVGLAQARPKKRCIRVKVCRRNTITACSVVTWKCVNYKCCDLIGTPNFLPLDQPRRPVAMDGALAGILCHKWNGMEVHVHKLWTWSSIPFHMHSYRALQVAWLTFDSRIDQWEKRWCNASKPSLVSSTFDCSRNCQATCKAR